MAKLFEYSNPPRFGASVTRRSRDSIDPLNLDGPKFYKPDSERTNSLPQDLTSIRSVKELITALDAGAKAKYQFFWGHKERVPGRLDESCLSNWYHAPFEVEGICYPTTEHFMMAEKARLFGDEENLKEILNAGEPGKAKALGRMVSGFSDEIWNEHRFAIVVRGNLAKFAQNKELGTLLLRTGTKVLVEASPQDRIWGIGMGANNPEACQPHHWRGENLLGFALMEVREKLQSE